jgi:hypothetical protein
MELGTWNSLNGVLHKSLSSVCVRMCISTAKQRLGKNVTASTNTHAKIEEFFGRVFFKDVSNVERYEV